MIKLTKVVILLVIVSYACSDNTPNGNNAPTLTYLGLDRDTMIQGFVGEGVTAFLEFEDVDGDILGGTEAFNISLIDNRDGSVDIVSFPELPELSKGQKGSLKLDILTTCCLNPDNDPCTTDTVNTFNRYSYDIFIEDAAGNLSNRVTTAEITLLCE